MKRQPAKLALEDGTIYTGTAFGANGTRTAEIVFNTSMAGYQEILTDPSYAGQIVTMTYPQIGNYGVNPEDVESSGIQVAGFIVREASPLASNFRSTDTLENYLQEQGVVGIQGIDTRALTRILRSEGAMNGIISSGTQDEGVLAKELKNIPDMSGSDLVKAVTSKESWDWQSTWGWDYPLIAMTAARVDMPEIAVQALKLDTQKNSFLNNGHNYQQDRLPIYLPGNGGLLTAVAMMAAGWDGAPDIDAPGFPKDGNWAVKHEGLYPLP